MVASLWEVFVLLLLQNEKPERRHTFASLALRKRYSYLAPPALSESDIFTNIAFRRRYQS